MEVNKDEALRCIDIAEQYIADGNPEKALKFLVKAEKLYSTSKAQKLMENIRSNRSTDQNNMSEPRRRTTSSSKENTRRRETPESSTNTEYSVEQLKQVQRIKKCKDYYEILNVTKEATDTEIKKSYKKLALQLHPDKNKAPGASEAFKAIGNAVAILTDVEKRKQYDLYGNNDEKMSFQRHHHNHHYQEYTRGFEADMTAEELFNMFFGTGFSTHQSNVFMRRNGRWHRNNDEDTSPQSQHNGAAVFIQLLPILLLIVLSMLSSLFISDPVFSLSPSSKYPITRHTTRLNVPYYVKENFRPDPHGGMTRLEANIEEEYVNNLRHNCYKERNHKDAMIWRAQTMGDNDLIAKAKNVRTPSCEEFIKIAKVY